MGLSLGTRSIADVRIQGVTLRPVLGGYELLFGLYLTIHADDRQEHRASIMGARIVVDAGESGDRPLGFARPEAPFEIICKPSGSAMTPGLHLSLQPGQVSAIEALRGTGDLTFKLLAVGKGVAGLQEHPIQDEWRVVVPRSDWIKQLSGAGARDILLMEVPLPLPPFADEWRGVGEGIRRAEDQYRNGDYNGCVGSCRIVIQELGHNRYKTQDWADGRLRRLATNQREMSKDEREGALWAALRHYTHQAHHGESEGGVSEYSRSEAEFVLRLTAAAVASVQTG